jgi:hypothetical protein
MGKTEKPAHGIHRPRKGIWQSSKRRGLTMPMGVRKKRMCD